MSTEALTKAQEPDDFDIDDEAEGMCECGKTLWNDCDCGVFFEEWICGMDRHGQCSMAGTEDCDFECPRMARERSAALATKENSNAVD